jgi:hypothetical protein
MAMQLNHRWKTVCVVGYQSIATECENRSAHGSVCLCQARISGKSGRRGRKVNSNGRHAEIGYSFALDDATLTHWEYLGRQEGRTK